MTMSSEEEQMLQVWKQPYLHFGDGKMSLNNFYQKRKGEREGGSEEGGREVRLSFQL